MKIQIRNLQCLHKIRKTDLKKLIQKISSLLDIQYGTISFVFTDNKKIQEINRAYLHKNFATDVICFGLDDKMDLSYTLGEIIISLEKVCENSKIFGTSFEQESSRCIIHGLLHLIGFDDNSKDNKNKMRVKEDDILSLIDKTEKKLIHSCFF